jgi:SOS-response transcriptional repressors (RecA-mediated autopeptidases)
MDQLKDLIKKRRLEIGKTLEQVGNDMGVSKATVHRWESGVIKDIRQGKMVALAKSLETTPAYLMGWEDSIFSFDNVVPFPDTKKVPLLGEIACGEPIYAEEQYGEYVEVDRSIKCDFALLAKGDSMIEAGIKDGYSVFIRKQDSVDNGEIAAVVLDDEATLKRVRQMPGGIVLLEACNPKYDPIMIGGESESRTVRILGKAVFFQGYL